MIERVGPKNIAAFIGEPVLTVGGVIVPPEEYWPKVAEICREHGILMIADEVVTAFGRLGEWFASATYEPDVIAFAKGVTSGYVPLGGVLVSEEIATLFGLRNRDSSTVSRTAAILLPALSGSGISTSSSGNAFPRTRWRLVVPPEPPEESGEFASRWRSARCRASRWHRTRARQGYPCAARATPTRDRQSYTG